MKRFFSLIILLGFFASTVYGATYINGDAIRSPDRTKVFTLPASSGALVKSTDNIATATALAADPADCAVNQYAKSINASGTLTCEAPVVTTNANLTGPITSTGNATAVAAQTGTGSVFVMQDTPTLTTPVIGAATGTSLSVSGQLTSTVVTGTSPLVVSSTTEVANLKAATATLATSATSATTATNLAGGAAGALPYQSASGTTALLGAGTSGQFLKSLGTSVSWVAAPAGGINYITPNHDAEVNATTGWANYADAAATSPVDGTAGAPVTAIAVSAASPLRDTYSYTWAKSAANRQGEGASYAFTISAADKGQVLSISFDYLLSGTYVDNDMGVWIYDVTNATLIQPAPYNILNTGIPQRWQGSFQAASNSTSYRLILHTASTSASAYTLQFDNVQVGPQSKSYGSLITDWISWTPTGTWVANTTYTGQWRRVGDSMEVFVKIVLSGAPTGNLSVTIPSGYTIDSTKLNTAVNSANLGTAASNTGASSSHGAVVWNSSTDVYVIHHTGLSRWNATTPLTWVNLDVITLNFKVPIVGWSSGQLLSSDADTRVVAFQATTSVTAATSSAPFLFTTINKDSHAAYSAATGKFTAPSPGWYQINAKVYTTASTNAILIYINGASVAQGLVNNANNAPALVSELYYLVANDTVEIRPSANVTAAGGSTLNSFSVQKISGPSQIAASESVNARYTTAAGQSIANAATPIIDFGTKDFDSHGSVTTGASWKFTCPSAGKYSVAAHILYNNGSSFTANTLANLRIYKNGVEVSRVGQGIGATALQYVGVSITDTISCVAGDYLDVRTDHGESAARLLIGAATLNTIAISRVGN